MSPPPTNIDGTDITGATIDGQDVDSITIDGQEVFSAGPNLPVALSNLVAWYPFDPSSYAGMTNNADDATDGLAGAGDTTAFDGTVNGATYLPSGGVTDINAGANSGAFDFSSNNDTIRIDTNTTTEPMSFSCFVMGTNSSTSGVFMDQGSLRFFIGHERLGGSDGIGATVFNGNNFVTQTSGITLDTTFRHVVGTIDSNFTLELFVDGVSQGTTNTGGFNQRRVEQTIGSAVGGIQNAHEGVIDDARVYNKALSSAEVSDIFNATKP
jgi:hypothetical protein